MKTSPLISVVMPVRNAAPYLEQSVSSVLEQSLSDLEMLVVDDGSSDGSRAILSELAAGDERIRCLDSGGVAQAAVARNTGLAAMRGRYVAFIDADDFWLPGKLERQLELMERQGAWFSFTAYEKVDEHGRRAGRQVRVPDSVDHERLLGGCVIGCSTVVIDTQQTGTFQMPVYRRGQDYACWLRLLRNHGEARGLDEVLACYREHRGSLSFNKLAKAAANWRIFRDQEELGILRAMHCMARYAAHGVRKRLI
ncbi:glycosyltransferase family 2 protein [Natronospira bacteriovora]|uniref:Glycosyltransferase family 2 protein n=1 Tax=Natronospira bacteriovora TaxID=3069753 RepID=A0ABU0WAA4_9GAMM|nr:glycosyltransferase family 2 protein [Natronospira sp. AB-CW4]MDQ2069900.1 glycosyltransferase family 2 protein [Natronospira sp. AB-CW4]